MTLLGTDLLGVKGGANPLRIVVLAFTIMNIGQNTPLKDETKTITVTLRLNVDLVVVTTTSVVNIAGFTGVTLPSDLTGSDNSKFTD
jgi:hypothetical protein